MSRTTADIITYGSKYGSTKLCAERLAELIGAPVLPYNKLKSAVGCERIIHLGALYAGGVMGLRRIVSMLPADARLVIVTVGLADTKDSANTEHIKSIVESQIPPDVFRRTDLFCLRGAIDYGKLSLGHRTMMAMLCSKAKRLPEEEKTAEVKAMLDTYGKSVSFVSDAALRSLADSISSTERKTKR